MRYVFIKGHRSEFPVKKMCLVLKVGRSGYYRWSVCEASDREQQNLRLIDEIRKIHEASRRIYGVPRIHAELKSLGFTCSKNRIYRLMKKAGIRSRIKRKYRATTNSKHSLPVAPNLLNQKFNATVPNEIMTGDITYIWTEEGWVYLAVVLDLYSRKVKGWSVNERMDVGLVVDAFNQAVYNIQGTGKQIFHSDRGSQYAAGDFRKELENHRILQSMSRKGNCYDNAVTESFFHSLKVEWLSFMRFSTRQQARSAIFEYIEIFYNRQRRHSSLGYMSPVQFEQQTLDLAA